MNGEIQIKDVMFFETDFNYSDMWRRSYSVGNMNSNDLTNVADIINSNKMGRDINPTLLSNYLPNMVSLKKMPSGMIFMPSGWGQRRYKFIIIASVKYTESYYTQYLIQGYTNYDGISVSDNIDPNMVLYFNSITECSIAQEYDTYTGKVRKSISNVKSTNFLENLEKEMKNNLATIRPADVHKRIDYKKYDEDHTLIPLNVGDYSDRKVTTSKRNNNISSVYTANIINTSIQANAVGGIEAGQYNFGTQESVANQAAELAIMQEANYVSIKFINALLSGLNYNLYSGTSVGFTYSELCLAFPIIDAIKKIIHYNGVSSVGRHICGDVVTNMSSPHFEVPLTQELTNSLTGLLVNNMLMYVDFAITFVGGQYSVNILGGGSLVDPDILEDQCEKFRLQFQQIVLPLLVNKYPGIFEMVINANIYSDTIINVSDETDMNRRTYVYPTFADSLYANVIATNEDKATLSNSIGELLECINYANIPTVQNFY